MKKHNTKLPKIIPIIVTIGIICLVVIILLNLMHGNTTVTNQAIGPISNDLLSCTSNEIIYPFFANNGTDAQTAKVDLIFANDKLKTISLNYTLYYNDTEAVNANEAINHAEMNLNFYKNNLNTDTLNAKYTKIDNSLRFNLYANSSDISRVTVKYFFIRLTDNEPLPNTLAEYQSNYESQGMTCIKSNQNQ